MNSFSRVSSGPGEERQAWKPVCYGGPTPASVTRRSEASIRAGAFYEIIKPRKTWMQTEI